MVASTHWLATAAGMAVLEDGGNAFDAAVAAGFVLQVVEPHLNGPGGEVPAVFVTAQDQAPKVLCGQGTAPAGATSAHFRELGLELVPGTGFLPATVPGAFGAWLALLRDHGTKRLRDVLRFAIDYAGAGHPLSPSAAAAIASVEPMFREHWLTSAPVWLPSGRVPEAGRLFRNPVLATTYRHILIEAESAGADRETQIEAALSSWYAGSVAAAIEKFCQLPVLDDSGRRHAGVLTGADLAGWRASYEEPVRLDFRGWTVCKVGGWSQGPTLLAQLGMLDALGELPPLGSADLVHRVVEVAKLAFADREAWYGDVPDVPLAGLLSRQYAARRAGLVGDTASLELRPGAPAGRAPRLPEYLRRGMVPGGRAGTAGAPGLGEPTVSPRGTTRGDTCHVDVVDRWGNMISATPSGGWLQSSPVVPGLGFCLGTRAQMFWLEEGLPNSLAPGKRPRSTLSPTLALRGGSPVLAFGTPGGDQQDQWQLGFFLNHAVFGLNLQAAIDAPTWHTTAFPSSFCPRRTALGEVVVEDRLGPRVIEDLAKRGHRVVRSGPWSLGRLSAVSRDPDSGLLRAAANPRGMFGYAAGR
ncbi:MAG: gamma-glutamyltransferase family protein [Actinobacteria bacterium]|nr:gamma-glutamyltransferase family protein [Actinomycetota bacterium]MBI3686265.1 gamma-glutamyltransferase family protein [Actinomycetota bacterium]